MVVDGGIRIRIYKRLCFVLRRGVVSGEGRADVFCPFFSPEVVKLKMGSVGGMMDAYMFGGVNGHILYVRKVCPRLVPADRGLGGVVE